MMMTTLGIKKVNERIAILVQSFDVVGHKSDCFLNRNHCRRKNAKCQIIEVIHQNSYTKILFLR